MTGSTILKDKKMQATLSILRNTFKFYSSFPQIYNCAIYKNWFPN